MEICQERDQVVRVLTPDMLVHLPAPGEEGKNSKNLFEKNMSKMPLIIVGLILVNLFFYGQELATGSLLSRNAIVNAGALHRASVLHGEIWRMLSTAFLHGSLGHLAGNMIFLYILGMAAEHAWGSARTALLYIIAALTGSLCSLLMHPGPSVGASGAIFGIMGALIVYFRQNSNNFTLRDGNIGLLISIIAVIQIVQGFTHPFIDNYAHIGGFLGGAATAFVLRNQLTAEKAQPWVAGRGIRALAFGGVLLGGLLVFSYQGYYHAILGETSLQLGQLPASARYSTRALEINPANARPLLTRSFAFSRMGNAELSLADLNAFVAARPKEKVGYIALAQFHSLRNERAAAISDYTKAIDLEPQAALYNSRGYSMLLERRNTEARADFLQVLKLDARYAPAYGNLGLLDAIEGKVDMAIAQMEKCLKMDKSQAALSSLIDALKQEQAGNTPAAVKAYDAFLKRIKNDKRWEAEYRFAAERIVKLTQPKLF